MDSTGIVLTNRQNETNSRHVHNYSRFDDSLSYTLYNTHRFGEYTPSFVSEGVPSDELSVNSKDIIDSLSLNAPFKGTIRKIKESFDVPLMAILPQNWDRIYTQPSNGDDVPKDANCVLQNFPEYFKDFWTRLYNDVVSNQPTADTSTPVPVLDIAKWHTALLRMLVVGEYIYSYGSLPHVLGYKIGSMFRIDSYLNVSSYDDFFDYVLTKVFEGIHSFVINWKVGNVTYSRRFQGLSSSSHASKNNAGSFRACLEFFRENPTAWFSNEYFFTSDYSQTGVLNHGASAYARAIYADMQNSSTGILTRTINWTLPEDTSDDAYSDMSQTNFNLSRILAYQLIVAHFYSNSSIDVIYSAELYRQYLYSLERLVHSEDTTDLFQHPSFDWNGISCPYDYLSGHIISRSTYLWETGSEVSFYYSVLSASAGAGMDNHLARFAILAAIFGFRKSLRYGDYFVGSRPRPLAPVNTDVAVNNNSVSVIDITRGTMAQKFGNSVMRTRQKIEDYVESFFGRKPAPDYHNPFFLSREIEQIFGDEVQNTAESQASNSNSRTANFATQAGRFTFTFHNDDMHPCIYLQIISYDIKRAYTRSVDRQFLELDRYDMFNPDFQFIGDQPVYGIELGYPYGSTLPQVFGYQSRDAQYKQRFDVASGGFVQTLPGWCLTDRDQSILSVGKLDPDFIRSYNTELDRLFLSLSGLSLGKYYHFICITHNNVDAKRPMAVDPQILG